MIELSPKTKEMMSYILPIYDNDDYILNAFEANGKEIDSLWKIVNEFGDQMFPQFATWSLRYWEQQLALPHGSNMSTEERRKRIITTLTTYYPINVSRVEFVATAAAGVRAFIEENIADYMFRIQLGEKIEDVDFLNLVVKVDDVKPAHLSYIIAPKLQGEIQFKGRVYANERRYRKIRELRVGMTPMLEQNEVEL